MDRYYVVGLNAVPWGVGPLTTKRMGSKVIPIMGRNQQLLAFQEAVREALVNPSLTEGEVEIQIYIWRRLEELTVYGSRNRTVHQADATNMQKAIEDSIQKVLIGNDRNVRRIATEIVQQDTDTIPCIVIKVSPFKGTELNLPDTVWIEIDNVAGDANTDGLGPHLDEDPGDVRDFF